MSLPLAGKQIVITRPIDQANTLSAMIVAAGGHPVSFPLIDIVGLNDLTAFQHTLSPLKQFDWAIFISSNAVQFGMPSMLQIGLPSTLKFAAIGPVTASQLKHYGVLKVVTPEGRYDSESLLALPMFQAMQGQHVLIVRGVGGRELLADTLKQRGAAVSIGECYRRIYPQTSAQPLADAHQQAPLHAIVMTSSEALQGFLALAAHAPWLKHMTLCVNHARIAEQARQAGLNAIVAEAPGDEAMLQLLIGQAAQHM